MSNITIAENVSGVYKAGFNRVSLAPVGNPVQIVAAAADTGTGSTRAGLVIVLRSLGVSTNGDTITINNRVFVFRTNPGPNDLQAGVQPATQGDRLRQLLINDVVLSSNYAVSGAPVSATNYTIELTAVNEGSQFNFTVSLTPTLSASLFALPALDGNQAQAKNRWAVYYYLYRVQNPALGLDFVSSNPNPNEFVLVSQGTISYNSDNRMALDVAAALAPFVQTHPPNLYDTPVGVLQGPGRFERSPEGIMFYGLEFGEEYIPPNQTVAQRVLGLTVGKDIELNPNKPRRLLATNSALSQGHSGRQVVNEFRNFWDRGDVVSPTMIEFLTQSPNGKDTGLDTIEFVYFFYHRLDKQRYGLGIEYNITYIDGTTATRRIDLPGGGVDTRYYVECGYRRLKASFPTIDSIRLIASFRISIYEKDLLSLAVRRVTVSKQYKLRNESVHLIYRRAQLFFLNPLGGFDTVALLGLTDREVETDRTVYAKTPEWLQANNRKGFTLGTPPPVGWDTEQVFAYDGISNAGQSGTDSTVRYTLRTGPVDSDHARWLQDSLATANKIYLLDWSDWDNAGNPNIRSPRQVVLDKAVLQTRVEKDLYQFELSATLGLNLAAIDQ